MKSILDIEVSCFKNYGTPKDPKNVNLLTWLTSTAYRDKVDLIRSIDEKKQRDEIKATLPAITPSGLFAYRSEKDLVKHSGFIQIDIDKSKTNLGIVNWNELKAELSRLPQVAYLGLSASGRGFWGLIPIPPEPDNHKRYFDQLEVIFRGIGIELDDKPKNIASLRGYSYDLEPYFNHQAVQFTKMAKIIPVEKPPVKPLKRTDSDKSYLWIEDWILNRIAEAVEGDRHATRLNYSRFAGGLIAGGYLPPSVEESIINSYLIQYGQSDTQTAQSKEIKAIRDGIKDGLNYPLEPPHFRCLFVPFTEIKDYSDKAFRIKQHDRTYFIPKSTVYEILEFGCYVSEFYLSKENKHPQYQAGAWKEFPPDAEPVHLSPINQSKDEYQTELAESESLKYKIAKRRSETSEIWRKIRMVRNQIRDHFIPEEAIRANKDLLRAVRG
jgi:hypothetical protein